MAIRLASIAALVALMSGCGGSGEPPAKGDYELNWYARSGTDYGPIIPGFKTLESCHHAGVSMTMARLYERPTEDEETMPWFSCNRSCRPFREGAFLRVCKDVVRYHGQDAQSPR